MSEFIYRYWKELPRYSPDKFSIVGGFDNNISNDKLSQHTTRIGNYYGHGEYAIDESELDNLYFEPNKIITIGADDRKPVSTVEPGLLKLFSNIDKNLEPTYGKPIKTIKTGGNAKYDEAPAVRYSDISDEILYSCPDSEGKLNEDIENSDKDDYFMAQEIDKNNNSGESEDEINSDSDIDIEIDNYNQDTITLDSDEIKETEETEDIDEEDTNIMQFLK